MTATSEGASDGTLGINLPESGEELEYVLVTRLRFENLDETRREGPFAATAGEYVAWFIDAPPAEQMSADQRVYLSSLTLRVELYANGALRATYDAGYVYLGYDEAGDARIMLPEEATTAAPGDSLHAGVDARYAGVDIADVPRPPLPTGRDEGPHSEEDEQ